MAVDVSAKAKLSFGVVHDHAGRPLLIMPVKACTMGESRVDWVIIEEVTGRSRLKLQVTFR